MSGKSVISSIIHELIDSPFAGIILVVVSAVNVNLTAASLTEATVLLIPKYIPAWIWFFILLILDFGLFYLLYLYSRRLFPVRRLSQTESDPCDGLILLVSTPFPEFSTEPDFCNFPVTIEFKSYKLILNGESLDEDIKSISDSNVRWNWQQLMRAVKPHYFSDDLKQIILIGSQGESGSGRYLESAANLLKQYVKSGVIIEKEQEMIDFERFDEIFRVIKKVAKHMSNDGIRQNRIAIDVTGGQKTASIAGAMATLDNYSIFQYVSTTPPFNVQTFNVVTQVKVPTGET